MKNRNVKIITYISFIACVVWIIGVFWTMNDHYFMEAAPLMKDSPSSDVEIINQDGYKIVALGDSLTRGTGDATGKGYIGYVMDSLKNKTNHKIQLSNAAIKGLTSEQLVKLVQNTEIKRQIKQANVIIMTIGGNDLFQGGQGLENPSLENTEEAKATYISNLHIIFKTLRELNDEAVVFHIGLYNPFIQLSNGDITSEIVREWNFESAEASAAYNKIIHVPTFDLFQLQVETYLFSDQFHPNEEGYKMIANRVAELLKFSEEGEPSE